MRANGLAVSIGIDIPPLLSSELRFNLEKRGECAAFTPDFRAAPGRFSVQVSPLLHATCINQVCPRVKAAYRFIHTTPAETQP